MPSTEHEQAAKEATDAIATGTDEGIRPYTITPVSFVMDLR
jgi:hypothetical protein